MNDRTPILLGAMAGAVIGGVIGYLYFTPDGQSFRTQLGPRFDAVLDEVERMRGVADRATVAVRHGWESAQELQSAFRGAPVSRAYEG